MGTLALGTADSSETLQFLLYCHGLTFKQSIFGESLFLTECILAWHVGKSILWW